MTKEDLTKILGKYEVTDKKYYQFLMRVVFFCSGDFRTILSEAERTNKKLYLIKDTQQEMEKNGLMPESFILIEDIGIK
ncbi:hypothetical protein [Flavobacterium muglaense]|uniref:Uncharacterized protein n=1 Tax=Flavobacterium muglaense TaxID=2764716 RepID=A0A923N445_9FLAO|nr:hypothetical protein [Flavobacterium muglaense]MBC5839215.1 hypothetical protein [Flavobacterium muglaense]MBC5845690.1 hypothetical protein [Flavobacterium muglaense]